jgi:hypothetical protein
VGRREPGIRRPSRALAGAGALVLALFASASADAPRLPATETREAIEGLRSPLLVERLEAVERLVGLGGAARGEVIAALSTEAPAVRRHLAEVLGRDGSPDAIGALLDALPKADVATAAAIRAALVGQAERTAPLLAQRLAGTKDVPARLQELSAIVRRARIERIFLGARSRSGGTGYYRGQFDALLPYREEAVDVCLAILADRRHKMPDEFPVGGYRFLRAPQPPVDSMDARVMAGNALAELLRPSDTRALASLARLYRDYWRHTLQHPAGDLRDMSPQELLLDTILPALYRLDPEEWSDEVEILLSHYEDTDRGGVDSSAMLLLRVGRYEEAIDRYRYAVRRGFSAYSLYNIACAYATWSREERDPAQAAKLRDLAVRSLEGSVASGYLDWPWMEQDTDLDPIRGDPRYKRLLAQVKAEFLLPGASPTTPLAPPTKPPPDAPPDSVPESPPNR